MKATLRDAYQLFHRGAIALADVEAAGIRIDTPYLDSAIETTGNRIARLTEKLTADPIFKTWKRRYGVETTLGSRAQLGTILFREMEIRHPYGRDALKRKQIPCDEKILGELNLPFCNKFLKVEKLKKLKATYLEGVRREVAGEFLHPSFNLHLVRTYRSSSDSPNFQNIPIRDPEYGQVIRRAFIPRKNHVLIEIDFKGAEVCISACYNKDPNLIAYITDPTKDMHRDMAMQLFMLPKKDISKEMRYEAKANFVFAEFYGAWHKSVAPALWKAAGELELLEHLESRGITELGECGDNEPQPGTFEHHVKKTEDDFWGRRFRVYAQWKKRWYEQYLQRGYFDMKTGFRCSGVFSRKECINYPVQGAAFHCLLWALIEMNRWLRKNKMRSVIVGQIHDSCLIDTHKSEVAAVTARMQEIITRDLPAAWRWICVPLSVEIEGSEKNWFEKHPLE